MTLFICDSAFYLWGNRVDWWPLFGDWRTMMDLFCQKVGSAEDYASCSGITDTTGEWIFLQKNIDFLYFSFIRCVRQGCLDLTHGKLQLARATTISFVESASIAQLGTWRLPSKFQITAEESGPSCYLTNKSLHIYRHRFDAEIMAYFGDYRFVFFVVNIIWRTGCILVLSSSV